LLCWWCRSGWTLGTAADSPNYPDPKQGADLGTILVLPNSFRLFTCQDGIVEGPYGFAKEADTLTEEWSSTEAGKVGYLSTGAEELEPSHLRFFGFVGLSVMKTEFGTSMAANPVLSKHPSFCGGGRGTPIVLETKSLWGKTKKKNESWQPHHQYSSLDPGDILR